MSGAVAACLFPGFAGTEPLEWLLERLGDGLAGVCLLRAGGAAGGVDVSRIGTEARRRRRRRRGPAGHPLRRDVALSGPTQVLELRPEPSIAAGPAAHGLAELLPGRRS